MLDPSAIDVGVSPWEARLPRALGELAAEPQPAGETCQRRWCGGRQVPSSGRAGGSAIPMRGALLGGTVQ